jgi:hypothetical protein
MSLIYSGARVQYCGHEGWFTADIYEIGDAVAVVNVGPITPDRLWRDNMKSITHHIVDFPESGCWKPSRGILVVPKSQLKVIENKPVAVKHIGQEYG